MASPHVAGAAALYIATHGTARNAGRRDAVLSGFNAEWSVAQSSACGFGGGRSGERLPHLTAC